VTLEQGFAWSLLIGLLILVFFLSRPQKPRLVFYFHPGCGHCHEFLPVWKKFVTSSETSLSFMDLSLLKCTTENRSLWADKGIWSFPSIFLYTSSKKIEFEGPRTQEGLEHFISENLEQS
jgi:hypothetical protein